jgi:hypothetical protein
MSVEVIVKTNAQQIVREVRRTVTRRLVDAGELITANIRQNISVPSPPSSVPGEYPHRVSGELHDSVHYTIDAARLELTIIADADHADAVERARPFLKRTIDEMRREITDIFNGEG